MLRGRRPVGEEYFVKLDFGEEYSERLREKLQLKAKYHRGIDYGTPKGTPCVAYRDGFIQLAGDEPSYGKRVWLYIDVPKEENAARVLYAHLDRISVVQGQKVKEGDLIGLTGETGKTSGPHLHFEVRELPEDKPIRPLFYISRES